MLPSSAAVGACSGRFRGRAASGSSVDTVLALTDAIELLVTPGEREETGGGGRSDAIDVDDDDGVDVVDSAAVPVVFCRRRVHGRVLSVATLHKKVREVDGVSTEEWITVEEGETRSRWQGAIKKKRQHREGACVSFSFREREKKTCCCPFTPQNALVCLTFSFSTRTTIS